MAALTSVGGAKIVSVGAADSSLDDSLELPSDSAESCSDVAPLGNPVLEMKLWLGARGGGGIERRGSDCTPGLR